MGFTLYTKVFIWEMQTVSQWMGHLMEYIAMIIGLMMKLGPEDLMDLAILGSLLVIFYTLNLVFK